MTRTISLLGIVDENWATANCGCPLFPGHPIYRVVAQLAQTDAVLIDQYFWPAFPMEIGSDGYIEIIKRPSANEWATGHRVYNTFGQMVKDHRDDPHGSDTPKNVWIIGSDRVCLEAIECAAVSRIRLVHIHQAVPEADRYFPKFSLNEWELVSDRDVLVTENERVTRKHASFIDQIWKRI